MDREKIIQRVKHLDLEQLLQLQQYLDQLQGRQETQTPETVPDPSDHGSGK